MYLKSMGLCGFKSFAQKTKLEIGSGINAVVGPNGCGKSNIVDALRWTLGEQSAYSLRSRQMMDVVFNGSMSRPPMNLAEVSLTFDNSENKLPIDYSEVTVQRKLFRSGESEYFINKTQCRLKDVRDLFLDTGVGAEGYSIFEQGKVEFITTAKPEERRELFEEAAGVSKYKVRREETLRKLDRVHNDMNRVNDILNVIKEQIDSLEKDVRKAKLYQKYQEELHTLEIAEIVKKIYELNTELDGLNKTVTHLANAFTEKTTQSDGLDSELTKMQMEQSEVEKELSDRQGRINEMDTKIAVSENNKVNAEKWIEDRRERKNALEKELSQYRRDGIAIDEFIKNIAVQIDELEKTVRELSKKSNEKETALDRIKDNVSEGEGKLKKLRDEQFERINSQSSLNNESAKLGSRLTASQTNLIVLKRDLAKTKQLKLESGNRIQNMKTSGVEELEGKISSIEEVLQNLRVQQDRFSEEFKNTEIQIGKTKDNYYKSEARMSALKKIQEGSPQLRAIRSLITQALPGIHGTVGSIIDISPQYTEIVMRAMGEKINYLICDTLKDAQEAIEYLCNNKSGWATFIILDRLPAIPEKNFVGKLYGEKPVISYISYEQKWDRVIKFLVSGTYSYNNMVCAEGLMSGGSEEIHQFPAGPAPAGSKSLEEEVVSLKSEVSKLEVNLSGNRDEIYRIKIQIDAKQHEVQKLELELDMVKRLMDKEIVDEKIKEQELGVIQNEITKLVNEEKETTLKISEVEGEKIKVKEILNNLHAQTEEIENSNSELKKQAEGLNTELIDIKSVLSRYQERLSSSNQNYDKLMGSIKEIEELGKKIEEYRSLCEYEKKQIDELYDKKIHLDKDMEAIHGKRRVLYEKIDNKRKSIDEIRHEIESLREELHKEEVQQKTKNVERNNLESRLQEFGINYGDVRDDYMAIESDPEHIKKLRSRVESMGSVNLSAPEQYSQLEQRHNFLLSQQQDLLKAEEDLRQAINKINHNIRDTFQETFEKVRENFRTIFHQLFEGGEADLLLTDENNLLESGVEIIAQPPGKKLQVITLFSGGEKALIAIALLFAFFMVKPSPICVLDEADAPLDDANIGRFINLIKSFSEKSQFIVITHNKRTIEAANTIYGITMEEYGVSKVISLRLQKIPQGVPSELVNV